MIELPCGHSSKLRQCNSDGDGDGASDDGDSGDGDDGDGGGCGAILSNGSNYKDPLLFTLNHCTHFTL